MTIPNSFLAKFQSHHIENILDNSKLCLSQIPIASHRKSSKTIPNCVSAKFQSHLIEIFLWHFQNMSQPNSNRISSKIFYDNSKLCLSQIPVASHRNFSMTFPKYVTAKFQSHVIKIILRQFQIVSQPNSNRISSKFFYDISKICLSLIPIASHRKSSMTIPNCVSAKFQSHLIENILRLFQIVS